MHKKTGRGFVHFFATTLWELEPETYRGMKRHGVRYLQILALVVRDFLDDQCMLRASALTFATLSSLVPLFALAFSVLKGLGVPSKVEPLLLNQVAAGSEQIVNKIITYINNTNMTTVGAIGLVTLMVTVITLLGNIEDAFNTIWGVRETRSLYRKFSDYLSVIVSGPILVVAATSITTSLQSQSIIQWLIETSYFGNVLLFFFRLSPYLIISLALVFLYIFIPNTRVRFRSALVGGIIAGTAWQLAQWAYLHFQVGVAKYNAIYGTLATLPVFMVWIYTSWLIVLFGVEVVAAHQNIGTLRRDIRTAPASCSMRELLTLAILQRVAVSFVEGGEHWSVDALAADLDSPPRVIRETVKDLVKAGYLVETADDVACYHPAKALDRIDLYEVVRAVRRPAESAVVAKMTRGDARLEDVFARVETASAASFAGLTLRDLADKKSPS